MHHGLAPVSMVAARTTDRRAAAQPPESAGWIAPMVRQAPAAYLFALVRPAERASGIGAALTARLHRQAETPEEPSRCCHEQANPLSVPFWSQQGCRPLCTSWETRPAGTLR